MIDTHGTASLIIRFFHIPTGFQKHLAIKSLCFILVLEYTTSVAVYVAVGVCGIILALVAACLIHIYARRMSVKNYIKHRWAITGDV